MILVVGASGLLGGKIATALREKGCPVRGLCRNPASHPELAEKGIELVQGDLRQPATLLEACKGVETVVTTANSVAGNGDNKSKAVDFYGNRNLIDAARSAGVKHFVFISMSGTDPNSPVDFARYKSATEEYLKASGLSYTIIRPHAYMEIWGMLVGDSIQKKGKCQVFGEGNNPVSFISVEDVKQFATLAALEPSLRNKTLEPGGPENLTVNQVVEKCAKFSGKTPKVSHIPVPMLRVMRQVMKVFNPGLSNLVGLSIIMDTQPMVVDSSELAQRYNVQQKLFDEVIKQRVAVGAS
jgi:uncharacterized protein YbjT (DUF2867 family)